MNACDGLALAGESLNSAGWMPTPKAVGTLDFVIYGWAARPLRKILHLQRNASAIPGGHRKPGPLGKHHKHLGSPRSDRALHCRTFQCTVAE